MSKNELWLRAPGLPVVARANQHQVAVGIGVTRAGFPKNAALRRASKGNQQLTIGPAHYGRKRAVEFIIFVDDDVLQLVDGHRAAFSTGSSNDLGSATQQEHEERNKRKTLTHAPLHELQLTFAQAKSESQFEDRTLMPAEELSTPHLRSGHMIEDQLRHFKHADAF